MNKIITWLGAGSMALAVVACGGKVVVDGVGENTGGAGGTGSQSTGSSTVSGTPQGCGDVILPSPGELMGCSGGVSTGSGVTTCETDLCDANGNIFGAVCSGNTCSCQLNGFAKCGCTTAGITDFCSQGTPCCPWNPIPL